MSENVLKVILSHNQKRAVAALLQNKTIGDAARACRLSEKTLQRYLADPTFRDAVLQAEGEMLNLATRRLINLADTAISTLEASMADPSSPNIRLRAAQTILDYLLKLRELRNVEQRLTDLEGIIHGQH